MAGGLLCPSRLAPRASGDDDQDAAALVPSAPHSRPRARSRRREIKMGKPLEKRPCFFKVMIGDFKTSLRIPPSFTKHVRGRLGRKSVLTSRSGRQWRVKVGMTDEAFSFQSGWGAFVEDLSLVHGDFLVFFYDGDSGFDVKVFGKSGCEKEVVDGQRTVDLDTSVAGEMRVLRPSFEVERQSVLEAACSLKLPNPHFIATFRKARLNHMTVPRALVNEYKLRERRFVILQDPAGNSWNVRASLRKDGRVELGTGWCDFCKGNSLRQGDVCVFESIRGGRVIHVHIFQVKEEITEAAREPEKRPPTKDDIETILNKATSFKTSHSNFVLSWRSSCLYCVTLPRYLVRELGLKKQRRVVKQRRVLLHDPRGRSWPVELINRDNGNTDLGAGWVGFSRANHLAEGDACIFEFIGDDAVQVHIFRAEETVSTTQ